MDLREYAEKYGKSPSTAYRLFHAGKLNAWKADNGRIMVDPEQPEREVPVPAWVSGELDPRYCSHDEGEHLAGQVGELRDTQTACRKALDHRLFRLELKADDALKRAEQAIQKPADPDRALMGRVEKIESVLEIANNVLWMLIIAAGAGALILVVAVMVKRC